MQKNTFDLNKIGEKRQEGVKKVIGGATLHFAEVALHCVPLRFRLRLRL
jgi:hypothetical protein